MRGEARDWAEVAAETAQEATQAVRSLDLRGKVALITGGNRGIGVAAGYGRFGVRANMVCPGYIERDGEPGRFASELAERGPVPRYGRPAEIAGVVVYLASEASAYHSGDTITIDGGWSINVR